jgi:hypothetical protein
MPSIRGRIKGVKNKKTLFLEARAKALQVAPTLNDVEQRKIRLSAFDMIGESLNVMGECLAVFLEHARSIPKEDPSKTQERLKAYDDALHAAAMLAPYRYPNFATIKINNDNRGKSLIGPNETYDSVLADLAEHMKRTGVKPTKMIDATDTAGLLPSKPKPPPPRPPRRPPPPPPP